MTAGIFYTMAGSWAYALNSLGITDVRWHVCTKEFKKPFQLNFPNIPFVDKYPSELEPVDLIVGSPPCIGMCVANMRSPLSKHESCVEHAANRITIDFAQTVKNMQPKGFVMEMVNSFMQPKFKPLFDEYITILERDYHVVAQTIDFVNYNVPQFRKRAIIMGLHHSVNNEWPVFPQPVTPEEKDWMTVKQALHGLPKLTETQAVEQKLTCKFNPNWKGPYSMYIKNRDSMRWKWDRPGKTVARIHTSYTIHPDNERLVTWREAARLMEYPDAFQTYGGFRQRLKFVSWGVPCNGIAYFIAPVMNAIMAHDLKAKRS